MKKRLFALALSALVLTGCASIPKDQPAASAENTTPAIQTTEPADTNTSAPEETTELTVLPTEVDLPEASFALVDDPTVPLQQEGTEAAMIRVHPNSEGTFLALGKTWSPADGNGLAMKQITSAEEFAALAQSLGYSNLTNAQETFDETFFATQDLILIPVSANTGSAGYLVSTTVEAGTVRIHVEGKPLDPDVAVTMDMLYAFLTVAVNKTDTQGRTVVVDGATGMDSANSGAVRY